MLNKIIDELETYFGDESDSFDIESLAHYIAFNLGCKSIDDLTYADSRPAPRAFSSVAPIVRFFIEGSRDIYDFDAETFEDAVKIVKRYGFDKLVEVF